MTDGPPPVPPAPVGRGRPAVLARLARFPGWLPVALVVVAEAAWISVLEGFIQAFAGRPPVLGVPLLVPFVAAGVVGARLAGRRAGRWWPALALALIVAAAGVGVIVSPDARAVLGAGAAAALAAVAAHPGGLVAGLAVLRGLAHARLPLAEDTVGRMLALGIPGIACLAIIGGVTLEPARARFLGDTFSAAIAFVGTGVLALTLARLSSVGYGSGWDWRRNPSWLAVTSGVLAVAVVAAVPLAAIAGRALEALIAIALGPLLVLGLTMGLDRTARRVLAFVVGGAVVVFVLLSVFGGSGGSPAEPPGQGSVIEQPTAADDLLAAGLGGLLLLLVVATVLVLAALWMRRARPPEEDLVDETRTIDRGADPPRRRPQRRFGGRPDPADAAAAYVALVEDIAGHPSVRRGEAETPAEHAARLRAAGRADLRLDLLAADYALARYGGVDLSTREHVRGIARWRLLRRRLTRPAGIGRPGSGA